MKILYDRKTIVATTDDERDLFSILFNQGLIRGAYIYWSNKHPVTQVPLPEWVRQNNGTAYIILTELEDPATKVNQFKKDVEDKKDEIDNANKELASDLFDFLK